MFVLGRNIQFDHEHTGDVLQVSISAGEANPAKKDGNILIARGAGGTHKFDTAHSENESLHLPPAWSQTCFFNLTLRLPEVREY